MMIQYHTYLYINKAFLPILIFCTFFCSIEAGFPLCSSLDGPYCPQINGLSNQDSAVLTMPSSSNYEGILDQVISMISDNDIPNDGMIKSVHVFTINNDDSQDTISEEAANQVRETMKAMGASDEDVSTTIKNMSRQLQKLKKKKDASADGNVEDGDDEVVVTGIFDLGSFETISDVRDGDDKSEISEGSKDSAMIKTAETESEKIDLQDLQQQLSASRLTEIFNQPSKEREKTLEEIAELIRSKGLPSEALVNIESKLGELSELLDTIQNGISPEDYNDLIKETNNEENQDNGREGEMLTKAKEILEKAVRLKEYSKKMSTKFNKDTVKKIVGKIKNRKYKKTSSSKSNYKTKLPTE